MNNIYKVIWSKAKNCYVVASEIARSHTKSATGSEKIGGVTRRSLLASLMALSLLCGGLGVASAANGTVHVAESAASSDPAVYTTEKVNTLLEGKADKTALENKANATDVAKNTENIATNKANINTLRSELGNKADESTVTTALGGKANTSLNNLDEAGKSVIKTMMADELAKKADKSYVDNAVAGAVTTAGTNVNEKLKDYAKTTYVDTEVGKKANKATTLAGYEITDAYTKEEVYNKGEVARKLDKKADLTALNQATDKINDQQTAIDDLKKKTTEISYADGEGTKISGVTIKNGNIVGDGNSAITQLANVETDKIKTDSINGKSLVGTNVATEKNVKDVADAVKAETDARTEADTALEGKINDEKTARENKDNELEGKITKNTQDIAKLDENGVKYDTAVKDTITLKGPDSTKITNLKDADLSDSSTDAVTGKQLNKTNEDLKTEAQTRKDMDTLLSNRADALEKNTGGITRNDAKDETYIEKNVTVDNQGNITAKGKVTANGGVDAGAVNAGSLNVTGASHLEGDVTMGKTLKVTDDTSLKKTDVDGALTVTGESSLKNTTVGGTLTAEKDATFEKNVTVQKDLTVNGKLNVGEIYMKNDTHESTGKTHDSATAITADGISNRAKVTDENGNTTESKFTHNEKGTFNYAKDEKITGEWKGATSNVTADGVSNKMTDSAGNTHTYYQTATESKEQIVNGDKSNFEKKTAEGNTISIKDKDADGNKKSLTNKQTVDGEKTSVTNKDSSSTVNQGADQIRNYVASTDGTKSSTEVKADGITNTSDGTITNDANHIENKANTMDTTVTGKATESYGELETTVNGNETHTVTGNQTNKIDKDQENIIGGNKTTTVTGNVKEDYKKDLTTTVGGNELHEVTGTKTENVTGKVTGNYKAGQATNVTGDQEINVSGTQTTTATDIKRNASSGMIDTIDNDYGTNTETKVAGKTTTDVSIKGTGEEGKYIRGANESRDYLIKGTLKNSETKTAEATSTEITDGTNKASTIQKVTDLAGSVTNGKETGVSGIHANKDGSVSIDSAVAGGGMSSVINQKKDSIQSAVGDGTNSTVILQDKDNVTIASSNGTVGIVGKDIVNNAQNTITNTAGTKITDKVGTNTRVIDSTSITDTVGTANRKIEDGKITDTAGDSTVTTEKGKGTTFAKTGSKAYSTKEGAPKDTNIAGNQITTGRVDANELGVSDKDGDNTADLSVKAGEGVKASAGDGNTKGSLDVKADKVVSSVKDADGKGSTFKQRIDAIMGNVKTADGESEMKQKGDEITSVVGKGEATNSHVTQKKGSIEAAVTDGTSTNVSYDEASVSTKKMTDSDKNTHTYYQTATESKEQLVNGDKSKSNFEKKTAEGNTISITEKDADGNPKSSLTNTQTVAGEKTSVTNNDSSSTINQGADQIRNNVTSKDGTKSSSTEVKADGITNTSVGTITNDAKDIVNKAQDTITNTAGTKITDTAGDSTVTTENGKGTTFTKTGSTAYREGGPTDTNISGNTITTGKVTMDYADVMKDLGVYGNTTLGEAGKDTTLTVNSKATFNEIATFENGAEVKNGLTVSSGGLNVTGESTFNDKVNMKNGLDVTGGVASDSFTVKGTDIKIDSSGINAGGTVISNVADGSISEGSKDAVNGGQLYQVKNDLEGKVNKVGANAAAMANLHPMEFDPDSKWNIAAAIGNYGSETAAALGAFYRPNDDVMVNLSTAFGTGENMVGGGVSVRLGKGGNKLSREENNALKDQVNDLTARMDALLSVLNPNMSKDFPDVPENHWAYEAVSRLAGNDIVQGYPDGEFHGERTMTRYEMAEIIYNALSRGAEAEKELVEEFKPELQAMAASEKATAERAEG